MRRSGRPRKKGDCVGGLILRYGPIESVRPIRWSERMFNSAVEGDYGLEHSREKAENSDTRAGLAMPKLGE